MTTPQNAEQIADSIRIPTLSVSIERIRAVLASSDVGMQEVTAAFQTDPPLAAKVLKLANSASYGLRTQTTSLQTAVPVLGLRALSTIVLRAGILAAYKELEDCEHFSLEELWKHSILTGQISESLARRCRKRGSDLSPQDYYTCGLLHDIGKVVLYDNLGEQYIDVLARSRSGSAVLEAEETRLLGMNHADAGSMAAAMWQLPEPVPAVIRCHHKPNSASNATEVVMVVACADEIANAVAEEGSKSPKALLARVRTRPLGLSEPDLVDVITNACASWEQLED